MDSFRYQYQPLAQPKKRLNLAKPIFFVLALTLLFVQATTSNNSAKADDYTPTSDLLSNLQTYLAVKTGSPEPPVYSKSYLLLNPETAEVVAGENINEQVPIASTTKMVTALVVRQLFDLNEIVTVTQHAAYINGSEIQLYTGEKITVGDLLKGLLIQSGNDTAYALAEHYSGENGNDQPFVDQMNNYVEKLGLKNTHYADPAGLNDKGYSTAWDLAQIARMLLKDPVLSEIVRIPKTTIYSTNKNISHELTTSNRLILSDSPYYLPKTLGIKTGFTPDAGHCLVSAYQSRNGLLIGVVLNTADYTITASAAESYKLYHWANQYVERRQY